MWLWVKTNETPFWGRCTTLFRTYFSGDWDVHRGYDLDFDPWLHVPGTPFRAETDVQPTGPSSVTAPERSRKFSTSSRLAKTSATGRWRFGARWLGGETEASICLSPLDKINRCPVVKSIPFQTNRGE